MKNINNIENYDLSVDLCSPDASTTLIDHLKKTGCAVLKNHNIPVYKLATILKDWNLYFSDERKYNWLRTDETDEGYIPLNVEMARNGEVPDNKELYQAHYNKELPDIIDASTTLTIFKDLVELGEHICILIDKEIPVKVKQEMTSTLQLMINGSNNHLLRIIHYPPTDEITSPRANIHTDICLLTIIFGAALDGLEFLSPSGNLFTPKADDDDLIVFNSDMLELATAGYLKSTPHQVKSNPHSHNKSRYSVVMAVHPRRGINLRNNITAGEYLRERLNNMDYKGDLFKLDDN